MSISPNHMSVEHNDPAQQLKRIHELIDQCQDGSKNFCGVLLIANGEDLFLHSLNANQMTLYRLLSTGKEMMEEVIKGEVERAAAGIAKKNMN
jgi:hypothetical protein